MTKSLRFSLEERAYIVSNSETDLVLTELGIRLVSRYTESNGIVSIEASQSEYEHFIAVLRDEFIWKSRRLSDPSVLFNLARRFLPDFDSIEPMNFS